MAYLVEGFTVRKLQRLVVFQESVKLNWDTEGSFMVERVYQIAEGCISDMIEYFPYRHDKASSGQENLQPERFLADIYYFQICTYTEQIAVINYLENFLGEHKDVRIVIIDSVTFHFRQDFDDLALRTRVLSGLSLKLMKLSIWINGLYFDAGTIVVLLNQVTTKFTEGSFQLTLALDLNRISLAAIELSRSDSPRGLQMTKGCRQGLLFSGADRIHVLLYSS